MVSKSNYGNMLMTKYANSLRHRRSSVETPIFFSMRENDYFLIFRCKIFDLVRVEDVNE